MEASTGVNPKYLHLMQAGLSHLPEGWSVVEIGDLLSSDRGISVGVMYPGDHDPLGIPLIRVGDLRQSVINSSPEFRISPEKHQEYRRTALEGGELLLTLVGDIGQCGIVPTTMVGWNAARAVAVIRLKDPAEGAFVRLCLLSRPLQHLMQVWATTTVQATLNLKEIKQLPLPWPPAGERARIAEIAGALDDKIELNRRMNETLEAMARSLFKSWFVDFDPVRAKAEGRQPAYIDAEIVHLFPDAFEESEMGPIPRGWRADQFVSLANITYGYPFKSSYFNQDEGMPVIRIRDLANHFSPTLTTEPFERQYVVEAGDVLIGMDGEFRAYYWQGDPALLNQRVCRVRPANVYVPQTYLNFVIQPPLARIESSQVGTTVIHLGKKELDLIRVVVPSNGLLATFGEATKPMFDLIVANSKQSRILAALRDVLLPRLLSGQIRMRDVEPVVEAAI